MGFVWSVPARSSKENDRACTRGGGGNRITSGGVQNRFGEGLYGMFSPPLSFPPWIVPGPGGCQKFVFVMGEEKTNKIPPKIPGQSCENSVYVFFLLCFFAPT